MLRFANEENREDQGNSDEADAEIERLGAEGEGFTIAMATLVLGSVSNTLVHKADCPVAIVRPEAVTGA